MGKDTLNGNPEWKDEIPDKGYELEDKETKSDHERLVYLEKVVKAVRKIWKYRDDVLFPPVQVEDFDVGGKHGPF